MWSGHTCQTLPKRDPSQNFHHVFIITEIVATSCCLDIFRRWNTVIVGLANCRGLITAGLQLFHHGRPFGIKCTRCIPALPGGVGRRRFIVVKKVQIIGMPTGNQRSTGRLANWALTPDTGEAKTSSGQGVQGRCSY